MSNLNINNINTFFKKDDLINEITYLENIINRNFINEKKIYLGLFNIFEEIFQIFKELISNYIPFYHISYSEYNLSTCRSEIPCNSYLYKLFTYCININQESKNISSHDLIEKIHVITSYILLYIILYYDEENIENICKNVQDNVNIYQIDYNNNNILDPEEFIIKCIGKDLRKIRRANESFKNRKTKISEYLLISLLGYKINRSTNIILDPIAIKIFKWNNAGLNIKIHEKNDDIIEYNKRNIYIQRFDKINITIIEFCLRLNKYMENTIINNSFSEYLTFLELILISNSADEICSENGILNLCPDLKKHLLNKLYNSNFTRCITTETYNTIKKIDEVSENEINKVFFILKNSYGGILSLIFAAIILIISIISNIFQIYSALK